MGEMTIRVENLGKKYRLGKAQQRHDTLRDALMSGLGTPWRGLKSRASSGLPARQDEIWALRDISFEVGTGEVVGIIGRNGAGKSTLLKILSRITEPSTGRAVVEGRVGSLLEVGTGFHPELTGRENIYLNGAILGMRRVEIQRKFDQIVAFSEIERFLDTPVKRYSSGMYVRLAFAVAAHLEPEVLVVDEVLAVGDAQFQQKCLGKMKDVAHDGRTVLFVSHNMDAIQRLCTRCLLIEGGQLALSGTPADTVSHYLSRTTQRGAPGEWIDISRVPTSGTGEARFLAVQYHSPDAATDYQPYPKGPITFRAIIEAERARAIGSASVVFYSQTGAKLVNADALKMGTPLQLQSGRNLVRFEIDQVYLTPGNYRLGFWLADVISDTVFDFRENALDIEVVTHQGPGLGMRPHDDGLVVCDFRATVEAWPHGEPGLPALHRP